MRFQKQCGMGAAPDIRHNLGRQNRFDPLAGSVVAPKRFRFLNAE